MVMDWLRAHREWDVTPELGLLTDTAARKTESK